MYTVCLVCIYVATLHPDATSQPRPLVQDTAYLMLQAKCGMNQTSHAIMTRLTQLDHVIFQVLNNSYNFLLFLSCDGQKSEPYRLYVVGCMILYPGATACISVFIILLLNT